MFWAQKSAHLLLVTVWNAIELWLEWNEPRLRKTCYCERLPSARFIALLWMLFFMHVCRCSNLISTTPGLLLPKRFLLAMFWLFSCFVVVSPISKRAPKRACSFCCEYCTFRFNFVAICMYFSWRVVRFVFGCVSRKRETTFPVSRLKFWRQVPVLSRQGQSSLWRCRIFIFYSIVWCEICGILLSKPDLFFTVIVKCCLGLGFPSITTHLFWISNSRIFLSKGCFSL